MKLILKNFLYVIKKFKTSSLLNILGLSAAFAVFTVLMIQVNYDLNFDRNFENIDDIYVLKRHFVHDNESSFFFNQHTIEDAVEKTPLIEAATNTSKWSYYFYAEGAEPESAISINYCKVRGDFNEIFTPTVIEGNFDEAIAEGGDGIALSESTARQFFGDESALGKSIIGYYGGNPLVVKAVIKDLPENCTLENGAFTHLEDMGWSEWSFYPYLKVKKENVAALIDFFNSDEHLGEGALQAMEDDPTNRVEYQVIPLADLHLHEPEQGEGNFATTMALLAIAILTLGIAYVNYINFAVAMAPSRVRSLNVQRIMGLGKVRQRVILASESLFYSLVAFLLSLLFVHLLQSTPILELFSADIAIGKNISTIVTIGIGALVLGLLFGIYPARYITKFEITDALKTSSSTGVKSSKLQSVLIVIQFVATFVLVSITIFIKLQHDHMLNLSWGIEQENILYIENLGNKEVSYKTLGERLKKDPRIVDYTSSRFLPGSVHMGWGRDYLGKKISAQSWPVTENYLKFFGVEVIYGEDFLATEGAERERIIVNEEFLRKYEFTPEEVIGSEFGTFSDVAEVVGIVKDFNFESLKVAIRPMLFIVFDLNHGGGNIIFIKFKGSDIKGVMKHIESVWDEMSDEPLDVKFLDERLAMLYQKENNLGKLVGLFSIITILIAIMGVYGLITFNTRYRAREIALRKINGASEQDVLLLVNRNMLIQLLIGFVIATPIAYIIINKWLEQFAYRIEPHWWVFVLSGVIVLLITIITVSLQSYRAATKNPVDSIKSE